jgi:hypothetical protein
MIISFITFLHNILVLFSILNMWFYFLYVLYNFVNYLILFLCYVFLLLYLCVITVLYVLRCASCLIVFFCVFCVNVYCATATVCHPHCTKQTYFIIYHIVSVF